MTVSPEGDFESFAVQTLGHRFAEIGLLRRALTHPSLPSVMQGDERSYQRLEFLGDRVLGLVIADLVFSRFPDDDEGMLSRRLTRLVRKETCAKVADALDFGAMIRMGEGEAGTGGRKKTAILGDVCEGVIAALYLDGGLDVARAFIHANWESFLHEDAPLRDAKTALQEWAHKRGFDSPVYRTRGRTGPDHQPVFTIEVVIPGTDGETGNGPSKRIAEQEAARAVLVREGEWETS